MTIVLIFRLFILTLYAAVLILILVMKTLKTLKELAANQRAHIIGFSSKLSIEYMTRLRELGFREGELVKCLKTPPLGAPRVFEVCGSVFSVEPEIACECEVEIHNT